MERKHKIFVGEGEGCGDKISDLQDAVDSCAARGWLPEGGRQSFKISNRLYNFTQNEYNSQFFADKRKEYNNWYLQNEVIPVLEIRSDVIQLMQTSTLPGSQFPLEKYGGAHFKSSKLLPYADTISLKYVLDIIATTLGSKSIIMTDEDLQNKLDISLISFGDSFEFEIKEVIEASKDKKLPDLSKFILQMYKRYYESKKPTKKSEFNKKAGFNPKYKLLSDIINEFTKDGIKIKEEVKKDK